MNLITQQQIKQFVDGKTIAIAGASRNDKSFSAAVIKHLSELNYSLWLVNPNYSANDRQNQKIQTIENLPNEVKHLLVLTSATETETIIKQAIDKGIEHIWIQQKSETPAAIENALNKGINLIHHQCIFMFTKPTGMHKFHRTVKVIFGSLPK